MIIVSGDISTNKSVIEGEVITEREVVTGDLKMIESPYTGLYEFTPSSSIQTIEIAGKTARQNIIVNPIPSNYGLITWDGSTLTVS